MIEIKRAVEAATALSPRAKSAAEDTIFRSPFPDIEMENHLLLHDYCLLSRMPQRQHRPCIIDGLTGKTHSYGEVGAMAAAMARSLIQKAGLRKGDVIMLLLCNSAEFVISFLASSMAATVATTANPFCTPSDIAKQCAASATKLIITTAACVPKLQNLDAHVTIVTTDEPPTGCACMRFSELLLHANLGDSSDVVHQLTEAFSSKLQLVGGCNKDLDFELPRGEVDDTVALPFSSGTTGLPKGVMLTHRSLVTGVAQQVDGENPLWNLNAHDVTLCVLPLFHIYAMSTLMLCSLRAGAAIVILPKFDMATLLQSVQRQRVTIAAVVPPIVLAMAKSEMADEYDLSSVRLVMSGAAPLGSDLERTLTRRLPNAVFGQGYGMTEAGPVLSLSPAFARTPLRPSKAGSCGCVVRCAEMKVVDQHSGVALPRNRSGEICIRGAQIMKGYLNNPEATAQTIDADGWLHTGDVGFVDDDDHVFLVDRVKEIIKFKGFQVAPAELEALLLTHPSIADAAVVPMKDEVAGEVPVAFVVKKEGLQGESVTEEQIRQMVAKQVVYYKRLYRVFFTNFIPKSTAGKILRKNLKERLDHLQ